MRYIAIAMKKPSISHSSAFLAAVVVLLLIAASMTYETYLEHSQQVTHQLETEATRIDRALILEIEHSSHLLQGMGQEITHMDPHDLNGIALLLRSFDTTATVHHVFSWIDADNRNVVSSNKGVHPPVDVSDRDYVKQALATPWKIHIGAPIQGRVSAKWALPVALGITDATGKYIGAIVISMDIYTITRDLQKVVRDSGIYFAIYSRSILPLTQSIAEEKLVQFDDYSEKLKSVDFSQRPSGLIANGSIFDRDSMYVYYELSATYPYIIMLGLDNSASSNALRKLLLPRLTEISLFGVFMLTLLWLVRLRIINPIAQLAELTAHITRGGKYQEPENIGAVDDLHVLAQQIRKLSDYLQETRRIEEENRNKNVMLRHSKEASDLSNRIKVDFLSSMSHALRVPLNTILGFTEIMKSQSLGVFENKQYYQYVVDIHEAAQQLRTLADDMQKLANAETSASELQEKHIDVRLLLNKCVRAVSRTLASEKLDIEVKLPEVTPRIIMDEQRLEQITVNILANIIDGNAERSHIVIRGYMEPDEKGRENFCISFAEIRPAHEQKHGAAHEKPYERHRPSHSGIPLTKALLAMYHGQMEVKSSVDHSDIIVIRFPKEKLAY